LFGYSENSLKKNFTRTAASIKRKYGVDVIKCKKGNETFYQIFEEDNGRALTIYDEVDDIPITLESLSYKEY